MAEIVQLDHCYLASSPPLVKAATSTTDYLEGTSSSSSSYSHDGGGVWDGASEKPKRKRKRARTVTDSAKKERRAKWNAARVSLGDQLQRWNSLRELLGIRCHDELAKVLLDCWYEVANSPAACAHRADTFTAANKYNLRSVHSEQNAPYGEYYEVEQVLIDIASENIMIPSPGHRISVSSPPVSRPQQEEESACIQDQNKCGVSSNLATTVEIKQEPSPDPAAEDAHEIRPVANSRPVQKQEPPDGADNEFGPLPIPNFSVKNQNKRGVSGNLATTVEIKQEPSPDPAAEDADEIRPVANSRPVQKQEPPDGADNEFGPLQPPNFSVKIESNSVMETADAQRHLFQSRKPKTLTATSYVKELEEKLKKAKKKEKKNCHHSKKRKHGHKVKKMHKKTSKKPKKSNKHEKPNKYVSKESSSSDFTVSGSD